VKPARWSLTARLTALYTLVAALVMAGLGVLVSVAVNRHFVELDRDYLADKIRLVQQIVGEAPSAPVLADRLDAVLASHQGLFIELRHGDVPVYGAEAAVFANAPALPGPDQDPLDWPVGERTLRGQDTDGDRQVEASGLLRQVGRREVDRDALARQFELAGLERCADALARLARHRAGHAGDVQLRQAAGHEDLDAHLGRAHAAACTGVHQRQRHGGDSVAGVG